MKFTNYILFVVVILFSGIASNNVVAKEDVKKNYIKVVYFHTDYRCATCTKLESYSDETLKKYFTKEIKSGKVVFEAINYETKANEHFVEKFNLYNKSLIIMKYENGKLKEWKNLEKIWELVSNKTKYLNYVNKEIKQYIKG